MVKVIIGIMCILIALPGAGVSALAYMEHPLITKYFEEEVTPGEDENPIDFDDPDPFLNEEDPFAEGDEGGDLGEEPIAGETDSLMDKLEVVSLSEEYIDKFEFARTKIEDPETAYINMPDGTSWRVEARPEGLSMHLDFVVQSTFDADQYSVLLFQIEQGQLVYSAMAEAAGVEVSPAAIPTLGAHFPKAEEYSYEALTNDLPSEMVQSFGEDITIAITGVESHEFGTSGLISLYCYTYELEDVKDEKPAVSEPEVKEGIGGESEGEGEEPMDNGEDAEDKKEDEEPDTVIPPNPTTGFK